MGTSLGVADTMALISSKLTKIVPWSGCCAVSAAADGRFAQVPVRRRRRCAACSATGAAAWSGLCRAGSRATGGRWSTAIRASPSKPRGLVGATQLQSAIVCPLSLQRRVHRLPGALSRRGEPRTPRIIGASSSASPSRPGPVDAQLDRVRANAGRLADRSAHRPAQPAIDVRAPVARAGARRAAQERSRAGRDGHRRLQGDQRHVRPHGRRPRAARGRRRRCRARCAPTICACATRATNSSSC